MLQSSFWTLPAHPEGACLTTKQLYAIAKNELVFQHLPKQQPLRLVNKQKDCLGGGVCPVTLIFTEKFSDIPLNGVIGSYTPSITVFPSNWSEWSSLCCRGEVVMSWSSCDVWWRSANGLRGMWKFWTLRRLRVGLDWMRETNDQFFMLACLIC